MAQNIARAKLKELKSDVSALNSFVSETIGALKLYKKCSDFRLTKHVAASSISIPLNTAFTSEYVKILLILMQVCEKEKTVDDALLFFTDLQKQLEEDLKAFQ